MCNTCCNFDHLRITLQSSDLIWGTKFRAPSLPFPPLIFSYLQALIHGFLWWWASSWLIFSLKWHLQSSFFHLHSASIDLQEAKDSIDEEDPRPTSSTWSYVRFGLEICLIQCNFTILYSSLLFIPNLLMYSTSASAWLQILNYLLDTQSLGYADISNQH